ncbi:peroxiredoxin, putative [Bodo saltans]|uniref:Peroxiredoxin, putative n=1 Tax=Bodo saltans TaxID=75058 RepID=A0A0S4JA52_BODSA|nr:peroxiredoxin, putative [Bodo saltans]|eukprot:CUG88372.1 peroxiredoxin, putative [Bodo saltans]
MRTSVSRLAAKIKVGDSLPAASIFLGVPPVATNVVERFGKGRIIIFGVPGAFTPGCTKTHLPGYVKDADKLKAKANAKEIICISVNDSFVMEAWANQYDPSKKIVVASDVNADFATKTGLAIDLPVLGGKRSSRFAMIVNDGTVEFLAEEPDGKGLSCSLSDSLLAKL